MPEVDSEETHQGRLEDIENEKFNAAKAITQGDQECQELEVRPPQKQSTILYPLYDNGTCRPLF